MINKLRSKKYVLITAFILIFLASFISTMPAWVLGGVIAKASNNRLRLYEAKGSFWDGSGLLVVYSEKAHDSAPLLLTHWKITLGLSKFIDVKFKVGYTAIADLYLNKHGLNLDNVNVSLSVAQVSQLFEIVSNFGLAGNLEILSSHILLGQKIHGTATVKLSSISSSLSPVNPLGSYTVTGKIDSNINNADFTVSSLPNSNLILSGTGNAKSLTLDGKINPAKKEKMLEFITVMGAPQGDGSYKLKIY